MKPTLNLPSLAAALRIHPTHAAHLVRAMRAMRAGTSQVAALADEIERVAQRRSPRESISVTPPRPTRGPEEREWRRLYARTSEARSNNLTRKAAAAMRFDYNDGDSQYEAFCKRFGYGSTEEVFRAAIRPWEIGWRGVEVGNVRFGKLEKPLSPTMPPSRRSNTPVDFYRLLYLTKPVGVSFDDMYGQSICGFTSPCRRFAMAFYFHKYELAAYQYVRKDLAVRTRELRGQFIIQSGIPGVDNGVNTNDVDAKRWFRMVATAMRRKWKVYPGNNFDI